MFRRFLKGLDFFMAPDEGDLGPSIAFEEDPNEDEPEVVQLPPGAEIPDGDDIPEEFRDMSKADMVNMLVSMKEQSDSTKAISQGLDALASKLSAPNDDGQKRDFVPEDAPIPQVDINQLKKDLNERLFQSDNPADELEKFISGFLTPIVGQVNTGLVKTQRSLLKSDPEKGRWFKKYESEIESYRGSLPPQYRNAPNIYEYCYNEVMKRHQDDVIEARVQEKMAEKERELEELKKQQGSGSAKREPFSVESGSASSGNAGAKRKKLFITDQDRRIAAAKGVDPKVVAEFRERHGRSM